MLSFTSSIGKYKKDIYKIHKIGYNKAVSLGKTERKSEIRKGDTVKESKGQPTNGVL